MIRGMTGQASRRFSTPAFDAEMEIRSINSRYFEFRLKCSTRYASFEGEARRIINNKLARGKIELNLRITEKQLDSQQALINPVLAQAYYNESKKLAETMKLPFSLSIRELLSLPQVLNSEGGEIDEETSALLGKELESLIEAALPMMVTEGEATVKDILQSISLIEGSVKLIAQRYPAALEKYKQNLAERVQEICQTKPSEERLAVEIELFASRTCVNEELVRLKNHLDVSRQILLGKRPGGSKELDFIGQELNREANTIASKSSDYAITEQSIVIKSEIEKMREHYRNIV